MEKHQQKHAKTGQELHRGLGSLCRVVSTTTRSPRDAPANMEDWSSAASLPSSRNDILKSKDKYINTQKSHHFPFPKPRESNTYIGAYQPPQKMSKMAYLGEQKLPKPLTPPKKQQKQHQKTPPKNNKKQLTIPKTAPPPLAGHVAGCGFMASPPASASAISAAAAVREDQTWSKPSWKRGGGFRVYSGFLMVFSDVLMVL